MQPNPRAETSKLHFRVCASSFSNSCDDDGLCDVVVEGLNHSGAKGALNIVAHASRAIVRSLARSCGKNIAFFSDVSLPAIADSDLEPVEFFFDPMKGVVAPRRLQV
jgi:hypothetical protein